MLKSNNFSCEQCSNTVVQKHRDTETQIYIESQTLQGELVEVERLRQRTIPTERWLEAVETANLTSRQGVGESQIEGGVATMDCSEALPNVLTWIAELEEHPDPADCGGVDYAAIYRYLAALCQVGWILKQSEIENCPG